MTTKNEKRFLRPKLITLAVASCFMADAAIANPTGAQIVNGSASITQAGSLLQITNTPNTIINWQSFSIGASEITRFIQQSGASAVLNRVVSQDPSAILGALQSNGRVFLINPNGIMFGAGAQVDVAGLVASTLNLSNADFLAGRMNFTEVPGAGSVVNQGNITTGSGGQVYLVAPDVTNSGVITSPQGEVVLAAGKSVELVNPSTPNLRVEVVADNNEARNLGQIIVDSGRVGIAAGLINNSGRISADSVVSEGGRILLKATKSVTLEDSSVLSAQGQGGGDIRVLADENVKVAGKLDASAPASGNGGFVETSAKSVRIDSGTVVTTAAANGNTGTWLVDPTDYNIAATGGDIDGSTLSSNLNSSNVVITSDLGASGTGGDVYVNDAVSWNSGNSLTLLARRNVNVNQSVTNAGTGNLVFYSGWDGASTTTPNSTLGNGYMSLYAPLTTGGNAILVSGSGIYQSSASPITANGLLADGGAGDVYLPAANMVNVLAGRASAEISPGNYWSGDFSFNNNQSLIIGSVVAPSGTMSGITAGNGSVYIGSSGTPINGTLTVNQPISATTRYENVEGPWAPDAYVELWATGDVTVNSIVTAKAANNLFDNLASPGSYAYGVEGGSAIIDVSSSSGSVTVTASGGLAAIGGSGGKESSTDIYSGVFAIGGGASVDVNAAGAITMNGTVSATGAKGGTAITTAPDYTTDARGGEASVYVNAGAGLSGTGTTTVTGGMGGTANGGGNAEAAGGYGNVYLSSVTGTSMSGGISAAGGAGGSATVNSATTNTSVYASADGGGGNIDVYSSSGNVAVGNLTATGAAGGSASASRSTAGYADAGASGGYASADVDSGSGNVQATGTMTMTGGVGGSATASGSSGAYADAYGGGAWLDLWSGSGSGSVQATGTINVTGGAGGNASATGSTAYAPGGYANVWVYGPAGVVISGPVTVRGGAGGTTSATALTPTSGTVNADGGEGSISANSYAGPVTIGAGGLTVIGGNAGSATSSGNDWAYARGGYADINLYGETGVTLNGGLSATAGMGGMAMNNAVPDTGYAEAWGGDAWINLYGGSGSITGGGALASNAGAGGTASGAYADAEGGYSGVDIYSGGPIALSGAISSVSGAGGNATAAHSISSADAYGNAGDAYLYVSSDTANVQLNGPLTVTGKAGGTASATGSAGYGYAYGGGGGMYVSGQTGITLSGPAAISGGAGGTASGTAYRNGDGGEGSGYLYAAGAIAVGPGGVGVSGGNAGPGGDGLGGDASLQITASGGALQSTGLLAAAGGAGAGAGAPGYGDVYVSADSATIGQVSGTSSVMINTASGAIVDGNAGLNVLAPVATLTSAGSIGSYADPLETAVANLNLSGTGEIGIINAGNLSLDSLGFSGSDAAIGATGLLTLSSPITGIGGNLTLLGNGGMQVGQNVGATGNVILNGGAGSLDVVGANVSAGGVVTLSGTNVNVGSAAGTVATNVSGSGGLEIIAVGALNIAGGSGGGASTWVGGYGNNATIVTGANLNVTGGAGSGASATLYGAPDVNMVVGGTVNLAAGSGAGSSATIEAASPSTINLLLATLSSGGFFVNGTENLVYDPATGTGFVAGGDPAILGTNFIVTYGTQGLPPAVDQAINQIVSTTNQQSAIIQEAVTEQAGANGEEGDKKKKSLPVCS